MSVVVVSNRVAGANTDEPISGGLAAALIPMVKRCGAGLYRTAQVGLVTPFHDGVSLVAKALAMSIEERRERWQQMATKLKRCSVQNWSSAFLDVLSEARRTPPVRATQPRDYVAG